ncbi:MAG TPA: hypothetical protein VGV93_03040 [Acidimicrobiales bacterium]|nr:hypothetical protein [Acidimicrobiales bacterium]
MATSGVAGAAPDGRWAVVVVAAVVAATALLGCGQVAALADGGRVWGTGVGLAG